MQKSILKKAQKQRARKQQKDLQQFIHLFFLGNSASGLSEVLNTLISHFLLNPDDWTEEFRNRAVIDANAITEFLTKLQESVSVMSNNK